MKYKKYLISYAVFCFLLILFVIGLSLQLKLSSTSTTFSTSSTPSAYPPSSSHLPLPNLTLDLIFNPDHSWIEQLPKDQIWTLITTGDVIPARSVNYKMTNYNDFTYPFAKTADFLQSADFTLINLESPLTQNCPVTNEGMIFCGNQKFVQGLKFSGIDAVNLANNHSFNWGIEGLEQTIDLLTQNQILTIGFPINHLATRLQLPEQSDGGQVKPSNNLTIGFLGWNLLEEFSETEILETVKQTKSQVDLLIVSLHWGAEYTTQPADWEITLAHQLIDQGADLIVGNHPHWIQPIEIYQGKLIIFAHGNFVFDQEWSQETKTGVVGRHTFLGKQLVDSQFFPIFISDYSQPDFLSGEQKQAVLDHLKTISSDLAASQK